MKIALSSDHAGFPLKEHLVPYLRAAGHEVIDLGVESAEHRTDYADAAKLLGAKVLDGSAARGILLCGSGVGASVAANKMKGIYCAVCHDAYSAAQGVEHDNMNILALGARIIGPALAEKLVDAFLSAEFNTEVERYGRRFKQVQDMEETFGS